MNGENFAYDTAGSVIISTQIGQSENELVMDKVKLLYPAKGKTLQIGCYSTLKD